MRVSILLPFIRRIELLKNSLRTLTSQTYHDVEIILIDDGSPTDEADLLAKEIGVVYNRLRGPGAESRIPNKAWLQGYDICRGDFVVLTYAKEARARMVPFSFPNIFDDFNLVLETDAL